MYRVRALGGAAGIALLICGAGCGSNPMETGAGGSGGTDPGVTGAGGDGTTTGVGGDPAGGSTGGSPATGTGGAGAPVTFTVLAAQSRIVLDSCGVTPSMMTNVGPGAHTITLTSSTMSKGNIDGVTTQDPYVIVSLPLPGGDPQQDMRFFTLNGIGASAAFTLPAAGNVGVMFIDSDMAFNSGSGSVTLGPEGITSMVDATNNVVRWQDACAATPASAVVTSRAHRVTLTASSLATGAGDPANYVLVRLPIEQVATDVRYVILNGIGDSEDFVPYNNDTIQAWFITQSLGATGSATLTITDL